MAGAPIEVFFTAEAHSSDAIQRAAYKFSDHFALELQHDGDNHVCLLHPARDSGLDEETVNAFRVEVLDQVLRERIRDETGGVRNVILALAFSKVGGDVAGVQPSATAPNTAPNAADDVTGAHSR
jgi:His-Xaa-Ser system protein HxsD